MIINAAHFNGGTIRWVPNDPYDNSSSITISIIQAYWWTYPTMTCTTNVPISTSTYSSTGMNLACVADCLTNGGYSAHPISILTDCVSASSSMGMMISQRSVSITLTSGAQFYLGYVSTAWRSLNTPAMTGRSWSVVSFIDLQIRSDGFINTPPVARVVSPQFAIVNRSTQIPIIVSDVNTGDDIRCRWSRNSTFSTVNECGGVCYPSSMPSGTSLSNCTLFFQGSTIGIWYAGSIQVEDFNDTASTTPMSSVPVQFLISVIAEPICTDAPVIIPLTGCLQVIIGVLTTFNISVLNLCDSNVTGIADIFVTYSSTGMQLNNLTSSSTNISLFYKILTWTPQANQIGPQQLCLVAYTSEFVQSAEYCITFVGTASTDLCATTTSTTTTTITDIRTSTSTPPGKRPSWGLVAGVSSLALPLALCTCCWLYRLLWSPDAKRQRLEEEESEDQWKYRSLTSNTKSTQRTSTPPANKNTQIEVPSKSYQVYNILAKKGGANKDCSTIDNQGSILVAIYNNMNGRRCNSVGAQNTEESLEMGNAWMQPQASEAIHDDMSVPRRVTLAGCSGSEVQKCQASKQSSKLNNQSVNQENVTAFPTAPFDIDSFTISQSHLETTYKIEQARRLVGSPSSLKDNSSLYFWQ